MKTNSETINNIENNNITVTTNNQNILITKDDNLIQEANLQQVVYNSVIEQFEHDPNALILTVYYVYQSIQSAQNNLSIIASELKANSYAQTYLNNQLSLYQYVTIPNDKIYNSNGSLNTDLPASYIQNIQAQNQAIGASRTAIQNQIGNLSNSAQVIASNLNTDNNIIQQSLQVGQALIQTFSQIVSLIANI